MRCLGPDPVGRFGGLAWGGGGSVQVHTWEGVSRPTLGGGLSRPTPGRGVQAQAQGVSRPRPGGGVSQHALRQTPHQTATAAGGTHPTGMHSCEYNLSNYN